VRAAIAEHIPVSVVPGANSILPALLLSGFPTDTFFFDGFLPKKKGELKRKLESLCEDRRTAVVFVPPHQLLKVLGTLEETHGDRPIAVVREMTKIHEEVRRGTAKELAEHYSARRVRGEIVLVLHGKRKSA
jgi:16S rRNA (cytidine1402-2'-O)-methyltransferase